MALQRVETQKIEELKAAVLPVNTENRIDSSPLASVIASTDQPSLSCSSLNGRVTTAPQIVDFPNLAWEVVKVGLVKESQTTHKINGHIDEAKSLQETNDLLIKFRTELAALPENWTELPESMKTVLNDLKAKGIDILSGKEFQKTKEAKEEYKFIATSHLDKKRNDLNLLFTTKINSAIQAIGTILDCLKDIVRNDSRLRNSITQHYAKR
jgi:hypothetical protein